MKSVLPPVSKLSAKAPTSITGFDEITGGGLPHERTSLLVGGPGSGKTLFALQFLMHGARDCKEPGIFVAFKENSRRIIANTNSLSGNTPLQISTIADTWIHLNYLVQAGERNHGLSIGKSRGTEHSNQVRELILSNEGVTLADIYTAGGEVLMGTMRWEKESAERVANEVTEVAGKLKHVTLDAEEAVLEGRAKAVQTELVAKQAEKTLLERITARREGELMRGHKRIRELRGADAAKPAPKGKTP